MTFDRRVGSALVTQVTELSSWPFPAQELFPDADSSELESVYDELGSNYVDASTGDLILAIHVYFIRIGGRVILVDTGDGNDKPRPNLPPHHMFSTDFVDRVGRAGFELSDVDVVINTHLHPDHCGWNTRLEGGRWRPTFPSATYLFSKTEMDWLESLAAQPQLDGVQADLARTFEDSVRPVLEGAAWDVVDDGYLLAQDGDTEVAVREAPGHTAGHLIVEIRTPDGGAVITGDVIHHPIQLVHHGLCQGGDLDAARALATRESLLQRCASERLLLMPAHFAVDSPLDVSFDSSGRPRVSPLLGSDDA